MTKTLPLLSAEYTLAKSIKEGNQQAQNELYKKYAGLMLSICMRYLSDKMKAEDVMIQGFMKVFDKIDQFNFEGSFEGWMKRIFVNEALMKIRSEKKPELDIDSMTSEVPSQTPSPTLETEDLMTMINGLPTGYRTVFNLYAIEGYSHAEIATSLGISEGTSKSQLSRARALLQQKLAQLEVNLKSIKK